MRRFCRATAILVVWALILALAGCGGHHHRQAATGSVAPHGWGAPARGLLLAPSSSSTPAREMFDSIEVSTVPARPFAVAGYTAGFWPTFLPLQRAFPRAHAISIAISARYHADCLDIEPGDAVPSQAGGWVRDDLAAGFRRPCLYGDLAEMPAIKASLAQTLGPGWRGRVLLWLAYYRFVPGLLAGYDAVQWSDHALGRDLDESTVSLAFLAIAHPPYVPPAPAPVCVRRRMSRSACSRVKAEISSALRAAAASQRAYTGRGCVVLAQRERYFAGRLRRRSHSRRVKRWRGALAATRRAEARQACSMFSRRKGYFDAKATRLEARA